MRVVASDDTLSKCRRIGVEGCSAWLSSARLILRLTAPNADNSVYMASRMIWLTLLRC
jgi:hypothetical protein